MLHHPAQDARAFRVMSALTDMLCCWSDKDVYLELKADSANLYETKLDKSIDMVEKCITWNELNAVEASKHARSIRLKMKSTEKITGHLSVFAIGKYDANGACEIDGHAEVLPKDNGPAAAYEGIIVLRSSSSGQCTEPKEVSEMWNGFAAPLTTVETGLDNGTETSGRNRLGLNIRRAMKFMITVWALVVNCNLQKKVIWVWVSMSQA